MRRQISLLPVFLLLLAPELAGAGRQANVLEGSVDACALLPQEHVSRALRTDDVTVSKGVLTQTWGSACRWSGGSGGTFVSVVVHTKHAAKTFNGLKRRLPTVRARADLAPRAYQSVSKIYLLERGAFITVEWHPELDQKLIDGLVKTLLKQLGEVAATQAVHR